MEDSVEIQTPQIESIDANIPSKKNKWIYIVIVIFGIVIVVMLVVVVYLLIQNSKLQSQLIKKEVPPSVNETSEQGNEVVPDSLDETDNPNVDTDDKDLGLPESDGITEQTAIYHPFDKYLYENCDEDGYLKLTEVPFTFSSNFKQKYEIQNKLKCLDFVTTIEDEHEYDGGSVSMDNKDYTIDGIAEVKLGDYSSTDQGMGTNYFLEDNFSEGLNLSDVKVIVNVLAPGPFGLVSETDLDLEFVAIKDIGDFRIVAMSSKQIETKGEIYDLFKRYGEEYEAIRGATGRMEYDANGKHTEFSEEFYNKFIAGYPNIEEPYKSMIDSVVEDVSGITPK